MKCHNGILKRKLRLFVRRDKQPFFIAIATPKAARQKHAKNYHAKNTPKTGKRKTLTTHFQAISVYICTRSGT